MGVSVNAKTQFEKYQQQGGDDVDCATGVRVDTVINRTDKTLNASKTVLSLVITASFDKE